MLQLIHNIKTLIFFTICLSHLLSQTYSISAIVLDSKTENPIVNANIYIDSSNFGTTTNKDGYFILYLNNQLENKIILTLKMIGYEQKNIELNLLKSEIDLSKIYLKSKSLELESIHIHSHENISTQISDITLAGQKLNDNLTGNIATTLSNQPNIGVSSFGNTTSKPVLRGYSGDRFLLTKDGNKMGDLSITAIDHAITLDITEVDEIKIIRGPKSLIYGSNAIGGVINASINNNPRLRVDKMVSKISLGGESFNKSLHGNIILYIPFKNNQINLSASNIVTENQSTPIGELENTYSKTSNYKLGFTKYRNNGYMNFIIENFNMDYGIPPSPEGHIDGVDITLNKNTLQINYHQDISLYNLEQLDIKYYLIDYEHQEFENNIDYYTVGLANKTHNIKFELQSSNLIIGSETNYKQFVSSGFYWTPKTDELDLSLYGFYEKGFKDFDFLGSLRTGYISIKPELNIISFSNLDYTEVKNRYFSYLSSSIGLRKIIDKIEINTWIMNTMKAPRIEELYSDGPHLGTYSYEIGEPNLELEKIYGLESSINYNNAPLNISLTSFYNYSPYYYQMNKMGECNEEVEEGKSHPCAGADFIEWGSGDTGWLYKYKTKGVEALIKGLELNLSYAYKNFTIIYDFSLVRGDDLTNKTPLSYINPDKQIMILNYNKNLLNYKIRLSNTNSQDRLGEFETPTASSFLIDFVIGYNKNNQNITIQFNNILDEKYYNHLSRVKSIMPEPGTNVILNYKILF